MDDLDVRDVTREFPTSGEPLRILRGVSLHLSRGENVAILGPSGSGKSTLLHIIGTLDRPSSGTVCIGGKDPFGLAEPLLADFRNRTIGLVFQDHHLLPQCTVMENVLVPALATGGVSLQCRERARDLLSRVGLSDRLHHRPAELSGGERQRVAIARALIRRPALLLADEPTGNLDRATAGTVSNILLEVQRSEQTMLVVVTHSLDLAGRMQRRYELADGRLMEAR